MNERLRVLTERVADDPTFLGHALARYQARHGLDCPALASWLGLSDPNDLASLALCRVPRPDHYTADLARIAGHLGADFTRLTTLLDAGEKLYNGR